MQQYLPVVTTLPCRKQACHSLLTRAVGGHKPTPRLNTLKGQFKQKWKVTVYLLTFMSMQACVKTPRGTEVNLPFWEKYCMLDPNIVQFSYIKKEYSRNDGNLEGHSKATTQGDTQTIKQHLKGCWIVLFHLSSVRIGTLTICKIWRIRNWKYVMVREKKIALIQTCSLHF